MTLPDAAAAVIDSTVRLESLDSKNECNAVSHSVASEHAEYWHCCHTDDVAVRVVTGVVVPVHTDAERMTGDG